MNVLRALLATAVPLLLLPVGAAQGEWTDPAGDYEVGHTTAAQGDDATYTWTPGSTTGWYPVADLRKVLIHEETPDTMTFEVQVAAQTLSGQEPHPVERVHFVFSFTHHGLDRTVTITWYLEQDMARGFLRTMVDNRSRLDETFDAQLLDGQPGWKVVIPKFKLRDADKIPLRTGDVLEGIRFTAYTGLSSTYSPCVRRPETPPACWKARDNILGGATLGDYEVKRSPAGVGHLELTSPMPLRSSNGLATTYIFELNLHNLGTQPDAAFIQLGHYPTEWTISAPGYIQVPGKSKATFPIAVSVPFTHLHGNETFVNITATSERDPNINALLPIGVVWTAIPQPSGHHPDLYLHAGNRDSWMNTLLEDPEADPAAKMNWNSYSASFGSEESYELQYAIRLSPMLESGLDFDRGDEILVKVPVEFYEATKPTIKASFHILNQNQFVLEIGSHSFEGDEIGANSVHVYEFSIPINESADRIPHAEDNNLLFLFEISYTFAREDLDFLTDQEEHLTPTLLTPDSYIRLPLVEYIDVVDETLLASLTKFSVTALTDTYKLVNPGRVASFGIQIDNRGDGDTLDWKLVGANPEWATIYPEALNVPGGGNGTVVVDVLGPELASEGENMNALLIGQSRKDPNSQVLVRLVAQVTQSRDVPDETPLSKKLRGIASENDAGAPGIGYFATAAVVLAAAAWRRRRD